MLLTAGWVLAGCSTLSSMNPVNWWHRQEGGKIAEDRPPPPGVDQPYPNMSTVPPRPAPVDQEAMKQLTDSLVADRTNAQHAAQSAPLADPSSPTASPGLFGVGTAPPPPPPGATIPGAKPSTASPSGTSPSGAASSGATPPAESGSPGTPVASASMPAVTAPAAPPSPAPRKAVQSTPLEAPPTQTAPAQTGPDRTATAPAATPSTPGQAAATPPHTSAPPAAVSPAVPGSGATASAGTPPATAPDSTIAGPSPTLPSAPPPRPFAAGAPAAMPVVPAPMPAAAAGQSAAIVFLERASNLSQPAADEVKAFAAKRGNGTISVVGYGDSTSSDPDSQSAALNLGLSRAQSIVDALKAAGVPGNAIRVSAEASGRGASLQLLQ